MKTWRLIFTMLLALSVLTGCGGNTNDTTETADADLPAFFEELQKEYGWEEGYLGDLEGELLENYYPGISDLPVLQMIAKAPMMSAVVNELVFLQCEDEDSAIRAEEILQARVDYQVGDDTNPGGAWYAESIEAWKQAKVIRHGSYVGLIASAEYQRAIEENFNALFN